jgi:DNA processing protein
MVFAVSPELPKSRPRAVLSGEDSSVYEAISDEPTHVDTIIASSGLPPATVSACLLSLELGRHVKAVPGGRFVKLM